MTACEPLSLIGHVRSACRLSIARQLVTIESGVMTAHCNL